ncbi:MAG: hypothetical protein LBN21_03080, partial [Treponema sp.]|nr:hypothetical protein [Treponema sp.]
VDEGSKVEETVTLKSVDLVPLVAEYVQAWQPEGLGPISSPSEPGKAALTAFADELGYSEDLSSAISFGIVKQEGGLPYPQAKASKFSATDKKGIKREGITLLSWVEYPTIYRVQEVQSGQAVAGTKNVAIFLTQSEADDYADKIRPQAASGVSIEVAGYNMGKGLTITLYKPLEGSTFVNWQMVLVDPAPALDALVKLNNASGEAAAIYKYGELRAKSNTWYTFTNPKNESESYFAIKRVTGETGYTWEVYKKK